MAASPIWTPPRDWVAGEVVDEVLLNEQVRDNEEFLYENMVTFFGATGITIQGGRTDVTTDGAGFALITFNNPFTTFAGAIVTPSITSTDQMAVSDFSNTDFTISWQNHASTLVTVHWLAFGLK